MGFKGLDKKTGFILMIGYVTIAFLLGLLLTFQVGMIVLAIGMVISGTMGIKNNAYVFLKADQLVTNSKRMTGFMLYMNYLLLFLGLVLLVQQF